MSQTYNINKLVSDIKILGCESLNEGELIYLLKTCDDAYFNDDASPLDDLQYDSIKRYAQSAMPSHPYFQTSGSAVRGGKVKLPFQMGSLTQKYEHETIEWVKKHGLLNESYIVTDKLDGTSALVRFKNQAVNIAYSKGDGSEGADITRHICKFKSIPATLNTLSPIDVRGEVIFSRTYADIVMKQIKSRSGEPYKNARNMTAGLMNASENNPIIYQYIDFIAYEIVGDTERSKEEQLQYLSALGFKTAPYTKYIGNELIDSALTTHLNQRRDTSDYELDGIVVEINKADIRKRINPTKDTLNPEYAIKYKVADLNNSAITTVVEVEWNLSKDGYYKPRVKIEPVQLVGVTIQHATGFNAKFIKENSIGHGARIEITRSGDVIPFIVRCIEPSDDVQLPDGDWTSTGVDLVVVDAQNNDTVKFQQLNDFFLSLDAPHLREGNLRAMFDIGYKTPEEIISMSQGEMTNVLGKAIGQKVFNGLKDKLTNIPAYMLMGCHKAFGRGVGTRKMKKLFEAFKGDMTQCISVEEIVAVDGFDEKTANKIVAGYEEYCTFFESISKYVTFEAYKAPTQGSLTGKSYVFTGFRNKGLEQQIEELGGKISTSVSKQTTAVIAQDPSESSTKLTKARDVGVEILSLQEFLQTLP